MKKITVLIFSILLSVSVLGQDTISLAFIGDIMQHTRQLRHAHIKGKDTLDPNSYDYTSYFKYTKRILASADFAVANMEFVCNLPPFTGYPSFSAPLSLAQETKLSGIDLFLCANNHIFDKGQRGVESTINAYDSLRVPHIGVTRHRDEQEKLRPHITEIKGLKFAFINFTYGTNTAASKATVNRMDTSSVHKAIRYAKDSNADYIIALPHWGTEYATTPSAQQLEWESFLYEKGVDIIIGSHPHVVQPVNTITDRDGSIKHITAYSLGNYISNMSAQNTQIGFIFVLKFVRENGVSSIISGEPIWLWCARGGRFEENYTTIPIEEFIDKPEDFKIRHEYDNMVNTYNRLKEIFKQYGK